MPFLRILFDSHPRPHLHPKGAAFIFFFDEQETVEYLSSLFQTDEALVESRIWDASLLGQYTAHVLALKTIAQADPERAFYDANIRILEEQANVRAAADREAGLGEENAALRRQMAVQQRQIERAAAYEAESRDELDRLRREVERLKRGTAHDHMPGAWVEPVSRRTVSPPRASSAYVTPKHLGIGLRYEQDHARLRTCPVAAKWVRKACCTRPTGGWQL